MARERSDDSYPRYVLAVLVLVYVFNFLDRQILSILAERIKADLQLTDAQIGFLYGTAFAVFYALFGLPLGRLADIWVRTRLISVGLWFWSAMTMSSALAQNLGQLTAARIGVGVGEASASPAAFSLLSDYFPPAKRASVLAIYSSGIYIGAGLGLGIGGLIVDQWDTAFPGATAPFGLRGWQVAFLAVGLPGILLGFVVSRLREPVRGQSEAIPSTAAAPAHPSTHGHPLREFGLELRSVLPPLTLLNLALIGAGIRACITNVAAAVGCALAASVLIALLGTPPQWIALAIGVYASFSWAQALAHRDHVAYRRIFHTRSLRLASPGFALLAFTGYGIGFWLAPFFLRLHAVSESSAGLLLGGGSALGGWLGVTLGGVWSDRWLRRAPCARLYVGMCTAAFPIPLLLTLLFTESTVLAFLLVFPLTACTSMWIGPGASTVQDLVPPRMRAVASAAYLLVITFIGLALGPYTIGRLSVSLGNLRMAMCCAVVANLGAFLLLLAASRHLEHDEAAK